MTSSPRYTSLRDYIRVIQNHRILIVVMTVVFALATFLISKTSTKTYTASATVVLNNPAQAYALAGLPASQTAPIPLQTGPINANAVDTGRILRPVVPKLRKLYPNTPPAAIYAGLVGSVSGQVAASTGLVVISANASQPDLAARIANDVARSDVAVTTQALRVQLLQIAAGLSTKLAQIQHNAFEAVAREQYSDTISRLQGLAPVITGAEIQAAASPPASPSSPKTTRNTILAAVVGFTLAIVIAFLHATLDRRVRSAAQIQQELALPLLGRIPGSAMGLIGPLGRGRRRMKDEELEAFRILRANLDLLDPEREVKMLAVTSPLAEQGKSTVAASLAFASSWAGRRTLLIETDLRRPSLAGRAGLKSSPGLTELLGGYVPGGAAPLERHVQRVPKSEGLAGGNGRSPQPEGFLDMLTAGGGSAMPAELLGSAAFRELLEQARQRYDLVILDTAPLLPVADALEVLPHADAILVCVRVGRTRADELRALRDALEHLPQASRGLVITGLRTGDEADFGYYAPARA